MNHRMGITFGEILDLLERDNTEVMLNGPDGDSLTGSAGCSLWRPMEERTVLRIFPTEDGLDIWLDAEDGLSKKNDDGNR